MNWKRIWRAVWSFLFYCGYVLLWTTGISAAGALFGAITFPIVGWLGGAASGPIELAILGARSLGWMSFIWAVGIGIVMAFRRAYLRRHPEFGYAGDSKRK